MIIFLLCIVLALCIFIIICFKKIQLLNESYKKSNIEFEKHLSTLENDLNIAKAGRHDYKNHLITLRGLIEQSKNSDALSYIDELVKQNSKQSKIFSGNAVVDSILNAKATQMKQQNVGFTIDANLPMRLNISAPSLTAMLSNILDNAIEAASQCENSYVDLKLKYSKNNFIILIKNPYEGKIEQGAHKLITTKKDKENHGFGLDIVRLTVKRLRGSCEIEHDNGIFSVHIIIPL